MARCFDSSFVVDYLHGEPDTLKYLRRHDEEELYIPSVVLFEGLQGVVRSDDDRGADGFLAALGWADDAGFTGSTVVEAGRLQEKLSDAGKPLSPLDAMVAATAKEIDATLVTRDSDLLREEVRKVVAVDGY